VSRDFELDKNVNCEESTVTLSVLYRANLSDFYSLLFIDNFHTNRCVSEPVCTWLYIVSIQMTWENMMCGVSGLMFDMHRKLLWIPQIMTPLQNDYSISVAVTCHVAQWSKHLGAMCRIAWHTQWPGFRPQPGQPAWGWGTPFPPLLIPCPFTSSSFTLFHFFPFSFSGLLYLFFSVVHPLRPFLPESSHFISSSELVGGDRDWV